jgi:hypothetical protein
MLRRFTVLGALLAAVTARPPAARAQSPDRFGTITFPTAVGPVAPDSLRVAATGTALPLVDIDRLAQQRQTGAYRDAALGSDTTMALWDVPSGLGLQRTAGGVSALVGAYGVEGIDFTLPRRP